MVLSGVFLGIIFYNQPYQGPFLEDFGLPTVCPEQLQQIYPTLCLLLNFPLYDPLPGQASLTVLAVSLCAVASSKSLQTKSNISGLRVFGNEKPQFKRESSTGINILDDFK